MVEVDRGQIWWADLPEARGSEPAHRRPVVVVQHNRFNRSRIRTVMVAAVSSNLQRGESPGNVFITPSESGLPKESVVIVTQVHTLDRTYFLERAGELPPATMEIVDQGLRLVFGL